MKHVKTFESFVTDSVSEDNTSGFDPKIKAIFKKFEDDGISSIVSDWWADVQSEQADDAVEMSAIMQRLGSTPETTAFFSSANDQDAYEKAMKLVVKTGLPFEERDAADSVQEIYVKAK